MSDQTSQSPLSLPKTDQYDPRGSIPNTVFAVALIAAVLGAVGGSSLALASQTLLNVFAGSWARPQLGIYLGAMCIFHLMEFLPQLVGILKSSAWTVSQIYDGISEAVADRV